MTDKQTDNLTTLAGYNGQTDRQTTKLHKLVTMDRQTN